jgi:hypothetical protein
MDEMPGTKWGSEPHIDKANDIYFEAVDAQQLPSPYCKITEETIEQHLAGQVTINLYAINPANQRCKWIGIDADYNDEDALRDLAKLSADLKDDGVYAVRENSRRGGHLWVFFAEPLPARQCRIFIYNTALRLGIPIKGSGFQDDGIEIFPKQDSIDPEGYGSALRAPLGIHRKNNTRYWLWGNVAAKTLEAQIEELCRVPKLTASQLNDLTDGMPAPPQWDIPAQATPRRLTLVKPGERQRRSIYNFYPFTGRKSGHNYFRQCPSCARAGNDTHRDNLCIGVPGSVANEKFNCFARCSTEDIWFALGCPSTSRT